MPAFTRQDFRLGGEKAVRYRFVADRVDTGAGLDPRPRHFPVSLRIESLDFKPATPTP